MDIILEPLVQLRISFDCQRERESNGRCNLNISNSGVQIAEAPILSTKGIAEATKIRWH